MADLSKVIPDETRSEQRYIQPAAPAPSFLEHLANFGSNVVGVAETAMSSMSQDAAKKNAAIDYAASNATAKTVWSVNGPQQDGSVVNTPTNDPGHNAAVAAVKAAAPAMLNAQTAGTQGAMDPGMVQAKNVAAIRQLMGQFPGHEAAIATAARELGVQNMLTQQYDNAQHAMTSDQDAALQRRHDLEHDAVTKYGYSNYDQMSEPDKQVVLAKVALSNAAQTDLDMKAKQYDLIAKQTDLNDKQNTTAKTQLSSGLAQSVTDLMGKSVTNLTTVLMNNLTDPAVQADPVRADKLVSNFLATALPSMDKEYATQIGPHLLRLTPEDRAAVDQFYQTQRKGLVDFLTGPTSVVEQNSRIMKEITDTYGIDFAKAAPKMMMYRQIVGQQGLAQLLDPTLMKDPTIMKAVTDELKGYVNGTEGTADFTTHLRTLVGDADLTRFTPQEVAKQAPLQIASMHKLSLSNTANNGTDAESHKMLTNAIKNTSSIAAGANEGWGFQPLLYQGKALTDDRVARALFVASANPDTRRDAIRSYVPAVARTYESLSRVSAGDKFYDLKLDPHTMNWSPVWNGQQVGTQGGNDQIVQLGGGRASLSTPKPTAAVIDQAATLNHMLHRLSDAAKNGYDPTFDGKKVSYMEARAFYAKDEIPASLQTSSTSKTKNGKTPEQNINDAVAHMMDFANKLQYIPEGSAPMAKGQVAEVVKGAAATHGVPEDIALRLIGRESSGNPNVPDSNKGAAGLGQVMPKTAAAYGVSDVHALTPQQQVDLSMRILADNYKKTGNWHDAVSMYHSGVDLKTAVAQNRSDGHMRTADYVTSIVGATPDLDTSGVMPLGVKTQFGTRL